MSIIIRDERQQYTAAVDSNRALRTNLYLSNNPISTDNPLPVRNNSFISINNSSIVKLNAGEVFTGESEDTLNVSVLLISIVTDEESAIDGLSIQYSKDGTNWDWTDDFTIKYPFKEQITVSPSARYFRIVYTNGSSDQTFFRLSTILKSQYVKSSTHRIKDDLSEEDDVEVNKSVLAYQNTNDGIIHNVSIQNPLPMDGDSVYEKDIWATQSTSTDFSGDVTDLFDNLHTIMTNTTSNNPKTIMLHFNRTIVTNVVGLGAYTGDFSNTKIEIGVSGHTFTTVIDESAVNTKYTSRTFQLPVTAGINALRITFHTADTISLSNCVILKTIGVIARLQATKPNNVVTDINATTAGNLKVAIEEIELEAQTPFLLRVAKGEIVGHTMVNKFGQNDDLNSTTYEDIWDGGGTYVYPADGTATIVKLIGHNAADTEPIEVQGLDINGDLVVQTKTLTGTTAVTLDTPLWRVFRLKNVGTSDLVDDVCAINTGDTQDYACINNGNNQTLMALYTIPNGKTGYLYQGTNNLSGVTRAVAASGKLWMRPYGTVFQLKKTFGINSEGSSFLRLPAPLPSKIPAKTDIRVSALGSANGISINTTFDILLIDD